MITHKKIIIPIFEYRLSIFITDTWDEVISKLPVTDINVKTARAVTMSNAEFGSVVAVLADCQSSIVHEAMHIKDEIWKFIGYTPQADNDEVDAYLITYIYEKIMEVFTKHNKVN